MSSATYESPSASEVAAELAPLPVIQLNYWAPLHEPRVAICGAAIAVFVTALIAAKSGFWISLAAAVALLFALWRLWAPIRYELDARGVQRIVFGRRTYRPWSDFINYTLDPVGVRLLDSKSDKWRWPAGVRIVAKRDHLRLVDLISTYIRRPFPADVSSIWKSAQGEPR